MSRITLSMMFIMNSVCIYAQSEIKNVKTEEHKQIKGTKIFIIPPSGFVESTEFQGFIKKNSYAKIEFNGEKPIPINLISSNQGYQSTTKQGISLISKKKLKMNRFEGSFVTLEVPFDDQKILIFELNFGNDKTTMTLSGTCFKGNKELEQEIINSMYSIYYDDSAKVINYSPISFTINVDKSRLNFSRTFKGALFYTDDGKFPSETEAKTTFVVGPSPEIIKLENQKSLAIEEIKRLPYRNLKIENENIQEITIDELHGYEISAVGIRNQDNIKELVYQVMIFSNNGYYTMYGTTKKDFESNQEMFKKISRTFVRKYK
jgi:hypothetical protein